MIEYIDMMKATKVTKDAGIRPEINTWEVLARATSCKREKITTVKTAYKLLNFAEK